MSHNSGLASQDSDYPTQIQALLDELQQMQESPQLGTTPKELEDFKREVRQHTSPLDSLLVGHHLEQAFASPELQAE